MDFFEKQFIVTSNEIDEYNHLNNVVYVKWMQDIATEHWNLMIKNIPIPNYSWFVIRHEINYKKQGILHDKITVKTWVGETAGIKSVRHYEVKRGEEVLVRSQTTFCLVDKKTQKPKRITKEITNLLLGEK